MGHEVTPSLQNFELCFAVEEERKAGDDECAMNPAGPDGCQSS